MDSTSDGLKYQSSNWFWFLFWRVVYSAPIFHAWRLLRSLMVYIFYAIFGVPIVFWSFYKSVYNFGPEHMPKRSFLGILKQPVPSEQNQDTKKVRRRSWAGCKLGRMSFRPRPISRKITRNKKLQDKKVYKDRHWESWNGPINNGPTSRTSLHANKHAIYSGFCTNHASNFGAGPCYVDDEMANTFAKTLWWITNQFYPPEIHFLPKPKKPPDGIVSSIIFGCLITAWYL